MINDICRCSNSFAWYDVKGYLKEQYRTTYSLFYFIKWKAGKRRTKARGMREKFRNQSSRVTLHNSIRLNARIDAIRKEEAVSRSRNSLKKGAPPNLTEISFLRLSWILGDASLPATNLLKVPMGRRVGNMKGKIEGGRHRKMVPVRCPVWDSPTPRILTFLSPERDAFIWPRKSSRASYRRQATTIIRSQTLLFRGDRKRSEFYVPWLVCRLLSGPVIAKFLFVLN